MPLGTYNVSVTLGVQDLTRARQFYEEVLGITDVYRSDDYMVVYKSGDSLIEIYVSDYAGTNQATSATWLVENTEIEEVVADLKAKGVSFEHYEHIAGVTMEGDIHNMGPEKIAWFKDPDGNILCIHQ